MARRAAGWGDAWRATLRNLGDSGAAQREIRVQRDRRNTLLGWRGDIESYAAEKQQEVLARDDAQRRAGQNIRLDVVVTHATILGGFPAIVKLFESGDPTRMDIFYGGDESPDGTGHGHIILRNGEIVAWLAHGANKAERIKIV